MDVAYLLESSPFKQLEKNLDDWLHAILEMKRNQIKT